jgi:hypothetical protein
MVLGFYLKHIKIKIKIMNSSKIKNVTFMGGSPTDIYDDIVDVLVTLENDNSRYWFEVITPQALISDMEEKNQKFFDPSYPFIIVQELTETVIKEALEAFINEDENSFWFKLYHSIPLLSNDDLNLIRERHNKELQAEDEKD